MFNSLKKIAVTVVAFGLVTSASATPVFVGSWTVDQGPSWNISPAAYTGQEAAALLFGGTASDYVISTIDNLVADINRKAWVSTWGGACAGNFPCGTEVADNYGANTGGFYLNPGDTSAYVADWAIGRQFVNYAFLADRNDVPEPTTVALLALGLAGLALSRRAKN